MRNGKVMERRPAVEVSRNGVERYGLDGAQDLVSESNSIFILYEIQNIYIRLP